MQCETPPEPGCFICFPLEKPPPPTLFDYTADCLPQDFIPPYVVQSDSFNYTLNATGGILYINWNGVGNSYQLYEAIVSQSYFANHMRLIMTGCTFNNLPSKPASPGTDTLKLATIYSGNISSGYLEYRMIWHYNIDWKVNNYYYVLHPFSGAAATVYYVQFKGLWIDLLYDPTTNKTTINYCGLKTEAIIGKKYLKPGFLVSGGKFGIEGTIDDQQITILE